MKYTMKILTEDCVPVGNKIYFFSKDWNGLYCIDMALRKTEFVSKMPEEEIETKRLCAGITYHKGKLILIPMVAKKIWIYDLLNDCWNGLERKYITDKDNCKEIFRAVEYKNNLFLIGSNYPAIIQLNLDTYNLKYLAAPYSFLKPIKKDDCYFRCDFALNNNQLFMASCLNNYVLRLDLESLSFAWMRVGNDGFSYSGIAWDGKNYWLSPRKGTPIVKWDGKDKTESFCLPQSFDNDTFNFLGVQYNNGKLIFPGMFQEKTLVINSEAPYDIEISEGQYWFYRCFGEDGVLLQTKGGLLQLKYPKQDKKYDMYCEISLKDWAEYIKGNSSERFIERMRKEIYQEISSQSISIYLSLLTDWRSVKKKSPETGENIWKKVRN